MRPRARAPSCPLATPLSFCPVSRFAPPSPTVRTSLLPSDDVCRRCNLACDRLFTLVVKFLHAPFWRSCTLAPGDICTPLPPRRYASARGLGQIKVRRVTIFFSAQNLVKNKKSYHVRRCPIFRIKSSVCGGCIPPPAIFKRVFDEYNFSIISSLFDNNKP